MHSYNKDIGSFGEALARDYLISKGYKILNMNFRNKFGDIRETDTKNRQNNQHPIDCARKEYRHASVGKLQSAPHVIFDKLTEHKA